MMRLLLRFLFALAAPFLLSACLFDLDLFEAEPLSGERFEVVEVTYDGYSTVVSGTIRNAGKKTWNPYWHIEGKAYSNASRKEKVGDVYQSFSFALAPGETTGWQFKISGHHSSLAVGKLGAFKGSW